MAFGTTFGIKPSTFSDVATLTGHWNEETSGGNQLYAILQE